ERAGPAAAGLVRAPVLDVPRREALARQRGRQVVHVAEVGVLNPAAAVEDRDDRERSLALGHAQLDELARVGAIRDLRVGRPGRQFDDIGGCPLRAGHARGQDQCDSPGAGMSELIMSSTAFHFPSASFLKTVRYLPRSVTGCLVWASVRVIE